MRSYIRQSRVVLTAFLLSPLVFGQKAKVDANDWDDVNFAFNSTKVLDAQPTLVRLAGLLARNRGYKVRLIGCTDSAGTEEVNAVVAKARAEAVRAFLIEYGAPGAQIEMVARAAAEPVGDDATLEGRFVNRRVRLYVTDDRGKPIGGPVESRFRPISTDPAPAPPPPPLRRAAAPPNRCYGLQVGTFLQSDEAERYRSIAASSGLAATVQPAGGTSEHLIVVAGCEPNEQKAKELYSRLQPAWGDWLPVRWYPAPRSGGLP